MQKRRFGRTGHDSTLIIFGAFAVGQVSQKEADEAVALLRKHGVNHIDVAPSYYDAELRLGPSMEAHRQEFFLGCKTMKRDGEGALQEMEQSLKLLRTDHFDLYQLHAVTTIEELDECMQPNGALEAIIDARDSGATDFIGITSHGLEAPSVLREALRRFDFDSVLFPVNFTLWANEAYRDEAAALLETCSKREVGVMAIKALAKGPWGDREPRYHTWYEPFDEPEVVERVLRFTLSQRITGAVSAGDLRLLPLILDAAERFKMMSEDEQAALLSTVDQYDPIFD